jgi:hypothetical protein
MIPPLLMVFTSVFSLRIYAMCDACSTALSSRLLQSTHCLFVISIEFPTSETSVTSTTGRRCTLFLKNDGQLINCAFAATSNHLVPYYSRFYIDKTDFPHPHISLLCSTCKVKCFYNRFLQHYIISYRPSLIHRFICFC